MADNSGLHFKIYNPSVSTVGNTFLCCVYVVSVLFAAVANHGFCWKNHQQAINQTREINVNHNSVVSLQLQGAVEADFQERFQCLPGEIQDFLQDRKAEVRGHSKSRPSTPHETLSEEDWREKCVVGVGELKEEESVCFMKIRRLQKKWERQKQQREALKKGKWGSKWKQRFKKDC